MQLQKSVSALQVDRSKSHTIFSILWSISLALCWYSWSIADSSPVNACVTLVSLNHASSFSKYSWVRKTITIFSESIVIIALLFLDSYLLLPHLHVLAQLGDANGSQSILQVCCVACLMPKALLVLCRASWILSFLSLSYSLLLFSFPATSLDAAIAISPKGAEVKFRPIAHLIPWVFWCE